MKKYAVIVAGGKGTRMGAPISKQYLEIGAKPVLMHTLEKFHQVDADLDLILVIPEVDFDLWDSLCKQYQFAITHLIVAGGSSRFQSVRNGLKAIDGTEGLVAIHDGVRPFVAAEVIEESYARAKEFGSAIAVIGLKDSIRRITEEGESHFEDRQSYRLVQTPQTFQLSKIKQAYEVQELPQFTDDATVYEYQGWQVKLISGNLENIKITTPEDMDYAAFLMSKRTP